MSLPDYPLEFENNDGDTALITSLNLDWCKNEYYADKLIRKGACVDKITRGGYPLLHLALRKKFLNVSKLLILEGSDVNVCDPLGFRPLDLLNQYGSNESDNFMPFFIINVFENLQNCLENYAAKLSQSQLKELTRYFCHPLLNSLYEKKNF